MIRYQETPDVILVRQFFNKWKKYPVVWNWYSVALEKAEKTDEALEVIKKCRKVFPDYLFGKINLATFYLRNNQLEDSIAIMGETPDLQLLYPNRDVFHQAEVFNYYLYFIRLEIKREDYSKAITYYRQIKFLDKSKIAKRVLYGKQF